MKKDKKRILIPIVGQGSIIHIVRTGILDRLSEFCEPVIALLWNQEDLINEFRLKGFEVIFLPNYKVSAGYTKTRYKINLWYLKHKLKTPSVNIQQKYLSQFKKTRKVLKLKRNLREGYYRLRLHLQKGYISQLIDDEQREIQNEAVYHSFKNWLKSVQVDGLYTVTPFLPEIDLIARILKADNKPIATSIHSFDNITKRGWQSTVFDHYIVWNKYNKFELQRIHKVLEIDNAITIAGAPQFDFHFNPDFGWGREEWLQRLSLPGDKKVILYSGGPVSLLPDEPQYLKALKEAFEAGKLPRDCVVLFRCHPLDKVERWKNHIGESSFIVYDSAPNGELKMDYMNVVNDDLKKLISTLRHTIVHINVVSTMCVDGSVFKKPQIGPYYDEVNPVTEQLFRQMYYQEHYLPIIRSGVINFADTKDAYIDILNKIILNPDLFIANCEKCVKEIITYSDGRSAERAAFAVKNFFER